MTVLSTCGLLDYYHVPVEPVASTLVQGAGEMEVNAGNNKDEL